LRILSTRPRQAFAAAVALVAIVAAGGLLGLATYDEPTIRNFATATPSVSATTTPLTPAPAISFKMEDDLKANGFTPKADPYIFLREEKLASSQSWTNGKMQGELTNVEFFDGQILSITRDETWCAIPDGFSLRQAIDTTDRALADIELRNTPFIPNGSGVTKGASGQVDDLTIRCFRYLVTI